MPPKNRAKAAGVSASSFLDLKAELSKQEDAITKAKTSGGKISAVAVFDNPSKKPTIWARQNKGVKARAARDVELEAIARPTLENARAALERKAKIYEKLRKGKSGGLSEAQFDALLVDFDAKEGEYESDSDDVDESFTVPTAAGQDDPVIEYEDEFGRMRSAPRSEIPQHLLPASAGGTDDDPMVEYEDEFGRIRTARRSEVPREFMKPTVQAVEDDDPSVIYNPTHHFPVYEPTAARVAQIQEDLAAATGPQNVHYDAVREVRARGAGFYQFSGDVEERTRQMDALRVGREETVRARGKAGAQDIQPGEVEGFKPAEDEGARKSRAMEKRKREIEERRKAVEAKRRKVKGAEQDESAVEDRTPNPKRQEYSVGSKPLPAVLSLEPYAQHAVDAALEVQISRKGKEKAPFSTAQAADDFLAQLERDMVQGQS